MAAPVMAILADTATLFAQIRMSAIALAHHFSDTDPAATTLVKAIIEKCDRGTLSAEPRMRAESLEHSLNDITNMLTVTLGHLSIAETASPEHFVNRAEELEYARQAAELGVSAASQLAALLTHA
jgi:hypothetical protein